VNVDDFIATHRDGATCEEVAVAMGVSKQRVHALEKSALAKLAASGALASLAADEGLPGESGRGAAAIVRAVERERDRVLRAIDNGDDDADSIGDSLGFDEVERAALRKRLARMLEAGAIEVANGSYPKTYKRTA